MTKPTWNVPRELAERAAIEHAEMFGNIRGAMDHGAQNPIHPWPTTQDEQASIDTFAALLSDLTRPASRDVAARELARRVKMECDGSPGWHYDVTTGGWVLTGDHHTRRVFVGDESDTAAYHKRYGRPNVTFMPGNPTDPAEALALALAATEPTNGQ